MDDLERLAEMDEQDKKKALAKKEGAKEETKDFFKQFARINPLENELKEFSFPSLDIQTFYQKIFSQIKENYLYYSLPPEVLAKISKKKLKTSSKNFEIYNEFNSEDYSIFQKQRLDFLNSQLNSPSHQKYSLFTKNFFLENQKEHSIDYSTILIGIISNTITTFFMEDDLNVLNTCLKELKENLEKQQKNFDKMNLEIYFAINDNISHLAELIALKFKNSEDAKMELFKGLLECTKIIKSNDLFFKILENVQNSNFKLTPEDKERISKQFDFENVINFSKQLENLSPNLSVKNSLKLFFNDLSEVIPDASIKKRFFIAEGEFFTFLSLYSIEEKIFLVFKIRNDNFETEDVFNLNLPFDLGIDNINTLIKDDLLYIYFSSFSNRELTIQIYNSENLELLKEKTFDFQDEIDRIFHDEKYLFCISGGFTNVSTMKIKLSLPDLKKFTLISKTENLNDLQMLGSFSINDIFYAYTKSNQIFRCRFLHLSENEIEFISSKSEDLEENKEEKKEESKENLDSNTQNCLCSKLLPANYKNKYICFNVKDDLSFQVATNPRGKMFQYLPSEKTYYKKIMDENFYEYALETYSRISTIFGTFDLEVPTLKEYFIESPQLFFFNINYSRINKLINLIKSREKDKEKNSYVCYFIMLYLNLLNFFKFYEDKQEALSELKSLVHMKDLKNFIEEYLKSYPEIKNKNKRKVLFYIAKISKFLKHFEGCNLEFDLLNSIFHNEKFKTLDIKDKLYYLGILFNQKSTNKNLKCFENCFELEEELFSQDIKTLENNYSPIFTTYELIKKKFFHYFKEKGDELLKNEKKEELKNLFNFIYEKIISISKKITKENYSILSKNSMIFKSFYFLLEFLKSNKSEIIDENIPKLINCLNILDKINYGTTKEVFDESEIYEVESAHPLSNEIQRKIQIKFPEKRSIYIKYFDYALTKNNEYSLTINNYTENKPKKYPFSFIDNVEKIEINFNKGNDEKCYGFRLQIIPVKKNVLKRQIDLLNYLSLIEKCIIEIVTEAFNENVNLKKEVIEEEKKEEEKKEENKKEEEKKEEEKKEESEEHKKKTNYKTSEIFNSKILQFINLRKEDADKTQSILNKRNENIINYLENKEQKEKITSLFQKFNLEEKTILNITSEFNDINYEDEVVKFAIETLQNHLAKKNSILVNLGGKLLDNLIKKLFSVILKYYGYNEKFMKMAKKLFQCKDNQTELNTQIKEMKKFEIFLGVWTECSKLRIFFNEQKSLISDEKNMDTQVQKFLKDTEEKIDFLYKIILPSFKTGSKVDPTFVKKTIDLIKLEAFSINKIEEYSKIQNEKCDKKLNQLSLLNILLFLLNKEENVNLVLYFLNSKFRSENKKLVSFIDHLVGADYLLVDRIKNQFHLMLEILESKIMSKEHFNNLSETTKLNYYQSLFWKIKGRDFSVLKKLSSLFEPLRNLDYKNEDETLFPLFRKFCPHSSYKKLFELFKIFTIQVFKLVLPVIDVGDTNEIEKVASLQKMNSKLGEEDYLNIIDFILGLFVSFKPENPFFKDFVLVLYKCLLEKKKLIEVVMTREFKIIQKLYEILTKSEDNQIDLSLKLMSVRLFYELLKYSLELDLDVIFGEQLAAIFPEEKEKIEKNFFSFIFKKFVILMSKENDELIKDEYSKILVILSKYVQNMDDELKEIGEKNIFDFLPLIQCKLNSFEIGKRINYATAQEEDFQNFEYLNDTKNEKYGYIIGFKQGNSLLSEGGIEIYPTSLNLSDYNINFKCSSLSDNIFYIQEDTFNDAANIIFQSKPNLGVKISEKNELYEDFLKKCSNCLCSLILNKFDEHKEKNDLFLLLKSIYLISEYCDKNNASQIVNKITEYLPKSLDNTVLSTYEIAEKELSELCLNNDWRKLINSLTTPEGDYDKLISACFSFEFLEKDKLHKLKIKHEEKEVIINGTLINSQLFKNEDLKEHKNIKFQKENEPIPNIEDKSIVFMKIIKEEYLNNENNESKICLIISTMSEVPREKLKYPIYLINKKNYENLTNLFGNLLITRSNPICDSLFTEKFLNSWKIYSKDLKTEPEGNDDDGNMFGNLFDKPENKKEEEINKEKSKEKIEEEKKEAEKKLNELKEKESKKLKERKKNFIQFPQLIKIRLLEKLKKFILRRILMQLSKKNLISKEIESSLNINSSFSIFRYLTFEYYLNLADSNISKINLVNLLSDVFSTISQEYEISEIFYNEFFSYFTKVTFDYAGTMPIFIKELSTKTENVMFSEKNPLYFKIVYEIILNFLGKASPNLLNDPRTVELLKYIIKLTVSLPEKIIKSNEFASIFIEKFLSKIYTSLLEKNYASNTYLTIFKDEKLLGEFLNFLIKKLDPNLLKEDKDEDKNNKPHMTNVSLNILKSLFLTYDIIYIAFYRYQEFNLISLIKNYFSPFFAFYQNFKILEISRKYDGPDLKENVAKIADFIGITSILKADKQNTQTEYKKLEIVEGKDTEIKHEKNNILSFAFEPTTKNAEENIKIVIYSKEKEGDKEIKYLQGIIDCSDMSDFRRNIKQYERFSTENLYFSTRKKIETKMFAFGSNLSNCLGINGLIANDYDEPQECQGLPKSIFNFGFGPFSTMALDEETHKIYSCGRGHGVGLKKVSNKMFTDDNRINKAENIKEPITQFACGTLNSTYLLTKAGNLFGIGANIKSIFGKDNTAEDYKMPIPISLPFKEKINKIAIGNNNAFIITDNGQGYGIGDNSFNQISDKTTTKIYNEFTSVPLPNNFKAFVSCSIGENYCLYLALDSFDKVKVLAQGNNKKNQCAFESDKSTIPIPSLCPHIDKLQFKKICARNSTSAALCFNGDLYIFGDNEQKQLSFTDAKTIEYPIKVLCPYKIEDFSLCGTHLVAVANGYDEKEKKFIRKIFACGNNENGQLGQINPEQKGLKEIEYFNNIERTPIGVKTCFARTFILTVNQNELFKKESECDYSLNYSSFKLRNENSKLMDFYKGEEIIKFESIIKSASHNVIKTFLNAKEEETGIDESLKMEDFLKMIKEKTKYASLCNIFFEDNSTHVKENRAVLLYLLKKIEIVNKELMKIKALNETASNKTFLNKAIADNLDFLNAETRMKTFEKHLENIRRYESEHCTIEIDRFKAEAFHEKKTYDIEFKETIFSQVYKELNKKSKFFLKKGSRLFKCELKGENATDMGGPYNEVMTGLCRELQSESLDLFIPSPNMKNDTGTNRDKYIINPKAIEDKYQPIYEFLGKLMASAISSGNLLELDLHPVVWEGIIGNEISFYDIQGVDIIFYNLITGLEKYLDPKYCSDAADFESKFDLNFTIQNSAEQEIELKPNGKNIKVTLENLKEFISLAKEARIKEMNIPLKHIRKGLTEFVPEAALSCIIWKQLEELVCGKNKIDIELLKSKTSYDDYSPDDQVVKWFWEWLGEASDEEQLMYIKFVWGRSRLPKADYWSSNHKICQLYSSNADSLFPHSATCFFSLKLPKYTSKENLARKMTYAIMNCSEIDGD